MGSCSDVLVVLDFQQSTQAAWNDDAGFDYGAGIAQEDVEKLIHRRNHVHKYTLICRRSHSRMALTPYSPMHQAPLATEADQRRMAEKLAKHSKPKVEVIASDAVQSGSSVAAGAASAENTPRLKWQKVNDWYAITECGRYRCHRYIPDEVRIGEHNEKELFQLEYRVGELWFYRLGPPYADKKEAAAAAQRHSEQTR